MVNLASVLSVSFLEDAVCADAGLCAYVCWEREERAGPQHRWLPTSDRLCIRVWGVDTPEHPHWMGTSDCTGTTCLPSLVIQHSRLTLCTSRWWPGWVGAGSQREGELGVWRRSSGAQASLASCLGAGAKMPSLWSLWAAALCQRRLPPWGCWGAHECR